MDLSTNMRLVESLEKIELTKTQRQRAVELYTNICKAIINSSDLEIEFYAQGSFATKTAVRPFKEGKDKLYDVDVICEVQNLDKSVKPGNLMDIFEEAIKNAGYDNYIRWNKCFTIRYAKIEDIEFSIDIIPSVAESPEKIAEIQQETDFIDLVHTSIAIPNDYSLNSSWISNNPSGYKTWFENQTKMYEIKYIEHRDNLLASSIEELPEDMPSNTMRNVIKILKRLRDVYFSRANSKPKPSSIVITTLVAKLANKLPYAANETILLELVVKELQQLKNISEGRDINNILLEGFAIPNIITNENNQWILKNPANGLDNILNSWNEENDASSLFFNWVTDLMQIVSQQNSLDLRDSQKTELLHSSLNLAYSNVKTPDVTVNEMKSSPWSLR